jgi:flagellar hook assembly protein FlgD
VRRALAGVLAGLLVLALAWTSVPPPAAAAVPDDPKVVLVVGATHGATAAYRSWMEGVAATAAQYTRNVVKVYSPNATWTAVKAALQGASIVVYMGHGNGFPSPYSSTLNPSTQNGLGLNLAAGGGDSNTKYYGEQYVAREVDLAPNAVVVLSHLCYASGNSEPGRTAPTLGVAKARLDNFAAGFLAAGARAVIADGHADPSYYVEQLFTTHQTIEQIWLGGPHPNGNAFSFPSVRSPGYTAFSDPDSRSGSTYVGFYRSLVAKPALTSDQVTGARYARTDVTPGFFVVPGAAEVVAAEGAGLYPDATLAPDAGTGLAPASLPPGTRLRVRAVAGATAEGVAIYDVATIDGAVSGFVVATGIAPRDSAPPQVWELDAGTGAFSPNGDGGADAILLVARASEAVAWQLEVLDGAGARLASAQATGEYLETAWDGLLDGLPVADGTYTVSVTAADGWGNALASATTSVVVDTIAPVLEQVQVQAVAAPVFAPNGDGYRDSIGLAYASSEPGTLVGTVRDATGSVVSTFDAPMVAGPGSAAWDGRTASGAFAADGTYLVSLEPVDPAGNRGGAMATTVVVYGALGFVASSTAAIHARDGDRFAKSTRLSFRLRAPATVTWTLENAAGVPVATRLAGSALAAGTYSWAWNGRLPSGAWAPPGVYRSRVVATDGVTTMAQTATVRVDAFRVTLSDSTPARGQLVTATIVSTEPLRANPRLTWTQPGRAPVTLATVRTSAYGYRVTFRLRPGGPVGPLVVRISGYDVDRGYNASRLTFTME